MRDKETGEGRGGKRYEETRGNCEIERPYDIHKKRREENSEKIQNIEEWESWKTWIHK